LPKRFAFLPFACAALALSAGTATHAGPWIDDKGRSTEMGYPGAPRLLLSSDGRTIEEGINGFNQLCLETEFDRTRVEFAAEALDWGFEYRIEMMPFNDPVDVGGWNSKDAALRVSESIFFNNRAQCNLTFFPGAGPDLSDVQAILSQIVGEQPVNADRQFKRNGEPRRHYSPEWQIVSASGTELSIFARPSPTMDGAYHFAVLRD